MITRVWGIVNSTEVDFQPVEDHPGYYEGIAPRAKYYQDIEIWAENHLGAKGHLHCQILIKEYTKTRVRLLLLPYSVRLLKKKEWTVKLLPVKGGRMV